jgi:hypothetical protein
LISRVRCVETLARRSSSKPSTVVMSSARTGVAAPCSAATLAAAAASITSFLRRPPRDNSLTPRGRGAGYVFHRLAAGQQPLRQMAPQTPTVFHRPAPLAELLGPSQQPAVTGQRRLNLQRRNLTVRGRLDHTRHMHPLVRIHPNDDHAELPFHRTL